MTESDRFEPLAPALVDFKEEYFPELLALDQKTFPKDPWYEEAYRRALKKENTRIRMIRDGESLVGYFFICIEKIKLPNKEKVLAGEVTSIAVDEKYRGLGLGECLLREAVSELWQMGAPKIIVHTRLSNTNVQNLNRKLGFTTFGIIKDYYGDEDALLMELKKEAKDQ